MSDGRERERLGAPGPGEGAHQVQVGRRVRPASTGSTSRTIVTVRGRRTGRERSARTGSQPVRRDAAIVSRSSTRRPRGAPAATAPARWPSLPRPSSQLPEHRQLLVRRARSNGVVRQRLDRARQQLGTAAVRVGRRPQIAGSRAGSVCHGRPGRRRRRAAGASGQTPASPASAASSADVAGGCPSRTQRGLGERRLEDLVEGRRSCARSTRVTRAVQYSARAVRRRRRRRGRR